MHHPRFSCFRLPGVILVALATLTAPGGVGADTPPASTAELMIVLDPAVPNEPATDSRPVVVEAHPIALPAFSAAIHPDGIRGRLAARVLEDGSVGRVRFESPRPPKELTAAIERGIAAWRFAPLSRIGKPVETWVNLVYSSAPSPLAGADAPPRSLFAILPEFPLELWRPWARTGAAAPVVSLPGDSAPAARGSGATQPLGRDNTRVGVAPGRAPLGNPGTGVSPDSHAAWFSGHVTLRVDIDERGLVSAAEVVRSTASCFESPAAAAIRLWRFAPAISAGQPTTALMIVPMASPGSIENPPPLFFKPDPDAGEPWDEPPRMRHLDLPVYPYDLLASKATGRASARVELDAAGGITRVDLIDSTRPEFGHALLASIERCQHDPARRAGRRVATTILRTAVFDRELWNKRPVAGETPALLLAITDPGELVEESLLDQPPHRIVGRPPGFAVDRAAEAPASATVEFVISRDGEVQAPRIVTASTPAAGYAAVQAVATWRYAPPASRGETTSAVARVSFASP